ncbi:MULTISPECIES: hypothetical protein [unclassified Paraburkholderia]|uniref:DUF4376 domain-containing protein n=1 Tax=unclassified Paraburkholderia TaxID=2615204 RepID=UPI00160F19E3|nr:MULTISPECIES: hypothetical protein [unclassified Paraburkholderia]MBB5442950.1 hypothetical protein [Paraburkholderia sp. WSM4177]MBB5483445.1 hypothetical protein [Paraburkholderia sp. WSM4180]
MTDYLNYTDVRNPVWADAGQRSIACLVKFAAFADYLPFTAMRDDPHAHGGEIFEACAAGTYGPVEQYVAPLLTPRDQYAAAIAQGIDVTCVATPALNATYGVSDADVSGISAEAQFVALYKAFTNGADTLPWPDADGQLHEFPDTETFMAFSKAAAQYASVCRQALAALQAGHPATFPSNVVML